MDSYLSEGYCNKKCFLESEFFKQEAAQFNNLLDRLSDDAIRCLIVFLNKQHYLMEDEYTKIAETRINK